MNSRPLVPFLCLLSASVLAADVVVLQHTIVDTNALNFAAGDQTRFSRNINGRTYQRPPTVASHGYQYTAYYNDDRHVCLGRRLLPGPNWEVIEFADYIMPGHDSHNVVTLGICEADGTIHLMFDHHGDPVNYRVSAQGVASDPESVVWDTNLFGSVSNDLPSAEWFDVPGGNVSPVTVNPALPKAYFRLAEE